MPFARIRVPGKVILFGEYAAIYGSPAISMAIDRYMTGRVEMIRPGDELIFRENGRRITIRSSGHVKLALDLYKIYFPELSDIRGTYDLKLKSELPSASGTGSSAAVTAASLGAFLASYFHYQGKASEFETGPQMETRLAHTGFEVEYTAQGGGSPLDTSTVTHGKSLIVSREPMEGEEHLWTFKHGESRWSMHDFQIPEDFYFVIGYSGIKGRTAEIGKLVQRFIEKNRSFGMDIIGEIGSITMKAVESIRAADPVKTGELMNINHKHLCTLGVSLPALDKMIDVAKKNSYGAKITGAGGGGCILALTDKAGSEKVKGDLEDRGFKSYVVTQSSRGLQIEFLKK